MRPFSSVGQAVKFYRRHGQAMAEAGSLRLEPRVDGTQGRGRRDDLMARGDFNGVPTAFFGNAFPLEGAVPVQVYDRAVDRLLFPPFSKGDGQRESNQCSSTNQIT